ncbi:protein phosphatase 2C domain-containing protein [Lysinibacillus sphaericus]
MNYTVQYVYKQGSNKKNEDAYVINETHGLFAVIDGATGLGGLPGDVASRILKETFESNPSTPLKSLIEEANQNLSKETQQLTGAELGSIPKYKRSTCGLSAVQLVNKDTIQFIAAGDCMLFIQHHDHTIRQMNYDHLDRLDAQSIAFFHQLLKEKESGLGQSLNSLPSIELQQVLEDCRSAISGLLKQNRNRLNTPDGYGVIDGSPDAMHFLESGCIPLMNVKGILLLSDGLKLHKNEKGWEESAQFAFTHGVQSLLDEIHTAEQQDPACISWPRLKKHDDKTGILIRIG